MAGEPHPCPRVGPPYAKEGFPALPRTRPLVVLALALLMAAPTGFLLAGMTGATTLGSGALASRSPALIAVPDASGPGPDHVSASAPTLSVPPRSTQASGPTWTNRTTLVHPPALLDVVMTYDPVDGYVVLFGGCTAQTSGTCTEFSNQTWTYQAGIWTNITSNGPHPSARASPGLTWDTTDGYVLLFGGTLPNGRFSQETWSFLGGQWTNLTGTSGTPPAGRQSPAMFNDTATGYVVLCCGGGAAGALGDTWKFVGGTWSPLTTTAGPECCVQGTMDTSAGEGIFFGGGDHGASSNTWVFSGGSWTLGPSGPSARSYAGFAYDPTYRYDVLFGGGNGGALGDTWTFAAGVWTQQNPTLSPAALCCMAETYDAHDGYLMIYGGSTTGAFPYSSETWSWSSVPMTVSASATPLLTDAGDNVTFSSVVHSGNSPYTYAWNFGDGTTSTASAPVHVYASQGTYPVSLTVSDATGFTASATLSVVMHPKLATPQLSASPDPATLGQPVNFTTVESGGTPPYTYSWNFGDGGLGGNLSNITHVYATNGPFMATVTVSDTLGAIARATVAVSISLQVDISANATLGAAPLPVSFQSAVTGGVPGYAYAWEFGDGTTSTAAAPTHTYALAGTYQARLTVTDSVGHQATKTWSLQVVTGGASLRLTLTATPDTVLLGNLTTISATMSGGRGQITLVWQSVPTWCSTVNPTTLACDPRAVGDYTLSASVLDTSGDSGHSSVTFHAVASLSPARTWSGWSLYGVPPWALVAVGAIAAAMVVAALVGHKRRAFPGAGYSAPTLPGSNPWAVAPQAPSGPVPGGPGGTIPPSPAPPPPSTPASDTLGDVY